LLEMALNSIDKFADIAFATVKLEPEEKPGILFDERCNEEEANVRVKQEPEFMDDEDLPMDVVIEEQDSEQALEDSDFQIKQKPKRKYVSKKRERKEPCKRKKDDETLFDCEHCDKKQLTKEQLKNHFYTKHVSSSSFPVASHAISNDSIHRPAHFGAIAAAKATQREKVSNITWNATKESRRSNARCAM
jgi:hypothetical protein